MTKSKHHDLNERQYDCLITTMTTTADMASVLVDHLREKDFTDEMITGFLYGAGDEIMRTVAGAILALHVGDDIPEDDEDDVPDMYR